MDRRIYMELFSLSFYVITYLTSFYFVCYKFFKKIIPIKFRNKTNREIFYLAIILVSFVLPFLNALIWQISNAFESRSSWYKLSHGLLTSTMFWICATIILSIICLFGVFIPQAINFDKTTYVIKGFFIHIIYTLFMIFIYTFFLGLFGIYQSSID